jgi:hypothetical protein
MPWGSDLATLAHRIGVRPNQTATINRLAHWTDPVYEVTKARNDTVSPNISEGGILTLGGRIVATVREIGPELDKPTPGPGIAAGDSSNLANLK